MSHTHHLHQGHAEIDNYNILFCTNINRHESPVRDYQQYKDYYDVSSFKFPEVTTTVFRTNHTNFCELSFDGTKSTKHHHRRNNIIKHVTSATTINCTTRKQEPIGIEKSPNEGKQVIEKSNKDTTLFHQLAEQFNMKLKFMETPVKLHDKNVVTNQKGNTFEVILSPKTPNSYSSIEAVSNILQSPDHRHKHIIISSKTFQPPPNKPDMRDREIQTKIIGIRNINSVNECFNMGLASVNDIFYNMDILPTNEDLYLSKSKKRKKLNLTMTHLPCIEIKCSSIIFEMPAASARRPQMPRRTLNTNNNSVVGDYHEARNVDGKVSEPITVNSSEATDNLKDKIFNLFSDTQMTAGEDFTKKVNDLCTLIKSFLSERKNKHGNNTEKPVKLPSEMYINIRKLKADQSNQNIYPISTTKKFSKNSLHQRSSSNPSTPQNRSRSISPQSQPSTSCQISKMPIAESNIQTSKTSLRCESNTSRSKKKGFDTSPNTSSAIQNQSKLSFTSVPSISTISNGSCNIKMALDDETDETQTPQHQKTVPRNVFLIPSHVNEILGKFDYKSPSTYNNTKPTEFQLENIKKTPAKPSWVVPDFVTKSQLKCDSIYNFQCTKNTKIQNRTDNNFGKSSVTFSSIIDIFGNDNETLEGGVCQTSDPKTVQNTIVPVTGLIKSKTYPNKQELYAMNNREETNYQNSDLYTVHQIEKKPKLNFEKQSSFYNSSLLTTKKDNNTTSCLQKRKDYDNKLKMQLQMQNKQASKIPLPTTVVEQVIKAVKKPTTKSKLPIIIKNEEIHNKQVICKSNIQAFSKLFTTDIKDTPFSKLKSENTSKKQESPLSTPRPTNSFQKSVQKNIENNLSVTKDVKK